MSKDVEWTMGSTRVETQRGNNEDAHLVMLTNNYSIGVFPVTQSQFSLLGKGLAADGFALAGPVTTNRYEQAPFKWHIVLFFHNFSTFLGRAGLYLEDLYVKPECRGRGIGKAVFHELARLARERGCGRLEWWCLDWNAPSIRFYKSLGAEAMTDWTVYRLAGEALKKMA